MRERNWNPPEVRDRAPTKGKEKCKCPSSKVSKYIWHSMGQSRLHGKKQLGHWVIQQHCTTSCSECGKMETNIIQVLEPCLEDFEINMGKPPTRILKALTKGAQGEVQEEGLGMPRPPEKAWRGFSTYKTIKKYHDRYAKTKGKTPCPITSPSSLLDRLMAEVHALTGEHSHEYLQARLGAASKAVTQDPVELSRFVQLLRNIAIAERRDIQEKLVAYWELHITPTGESWFQYGTKISKWIFSWLGIPEDQFFPRGIRVHPKAVVEIGKRGRLPGIPEDDQKFLERLEKDEAMATRRIKEMARKTQKDKTQSTGTSSRTTSSEGVATQPSGKDQFLEQTLTRILGAPARLAPKTGLWSSNVASLLPPIPLFDRDNGEGPHLLHEVGVPGKRITVVNLCSEGMAMRVLQGEDDEIIIVLSPPTQKEGHK